MRKQLHALAEEHQNALEELRSTYEELHVFLATLSHELRDLGADPHRRAVIAILAARPARPGLRGPA